MTRSPRLTWRLLVCLNVNRDFVTNPFQHHKLQIKQTVDNDLGNDFPGCTRKHPSRNPEWQVRFAKTGLTM